jgi:hypothetical protein
MWRRGCSARVVSAAQLCLAHLRHMWPAHDLTAGGMGGVSARRPLRCTNRTKVVEWIAQQGAGARGGPASAPRSAAASASCRNHTRHVNACRRMLHPGQHAPAHRLTGSPGHRGVLSQDSTRTHARLALAGILSLSISQDSLCSIHVVASSPRRLRHLGGRLAAALPAPAARRAGAHQPRGRPAVRPTARNPVRPVRT